MAFRQPQRWKKKCVKCGNEFSTHSTNRDDCYSCRGKCREIHYFRNKKAIKPKTQVSQHE